MPRVSPGNTFSFASWVNDSRCLTTGVYSCWSLSTRLWLTAQNHQWGKEWGRGRGDVGSCLSCFSPTPFADWVWCPSAVTCLTQSVPKAFHTCHPGPLSLDLSLWGILSFLFQLFSSAGNDLLDNPTGSVAGTQSPRNGQWNSTIERLPMNGGAEQM